MSAIMLNHLTIVETEPKRRESSVVIEEGRRESIITGLMIIRPDDTESTESHRLAVPNGDASEGPEQARIIPSSLNSVNGSLLIPTQSFDEPEQH